MSAPTEGHRARLVWSGFVVGLALVVTVVWAVGGFEKRSDLLQSTPAGTTIATGPYVFTFTEVTAQKKTNFENEDYWQLTAVGTGRTTGDESIAPDFGETGTFVSKDIRSGEVQVPSGLRFDGRESYGDGRYFTPGLAPIPFEVVFDYQGSYVPDATLVFVVFELEFVDTSLIGGQDKSWNATDQGFDFRLPVRVLSEASR